MDVNYWVAILGAVAGFVGAIGVFMARSGLSGVIRSGTQREETAVGQMAGLLERLATAQIDREAHLLQIQDKALETVAQMTESVTRVAVGLDTHGNDTRNYVAQLGQTQERILTEIQGTREDIVTMSHLMSDLGTEVISCARWIKTNGEKPKTPERRQT